MAAISYPPHSLPGFGALRPRHLRPVPAPRSFAPAPSRARREVRPLASPSSATYRRRRAVALVLLVSLALGGLMLASRAVSAVGAAVLTEAPVAEPTFAAPAAATPAAAHRYVVQPGDTLWSIARQLQPEGDVRPLVDQLSARHGGSALQAGERLDLDGLGR
jgi:Tfp pilus assembly protein FimV